MTRTKAPSLNKPKQPTEEELRLQAARAMAQQHHSMAQAFAANICHATPFDILKENGAQDIADFADALATALMDNWYKPKEDENGKQ